jgi:GNAT superfamily N-acetyltransferase
MPTPFPLQRLDDRDVGQMIALYERINWRIHIDYLHWMLDWSEGGAFGITYRNKLLATAIGLPYDDKRGWLAMVVTDPSFQRRGLGQRITQTAVDFLVKRGLSEVMLDASPMGLPLYEHMGFTALYPMITYRGLPALDESPPHDERIRQAADADLPAMIALAGDAGACRHVDRRQLRTVGAIDLESDTGTGRETAVAVRRRVDLEGAEVVVGAGEAGERGEPVVHHSQELLGAGIGARQAQRLLLRRQHRGKDLGGRRRVRLGAEKGEAGVFGPLILRLLLLRAEGCRDEK